MPKMDKDMYNEDDCDEIKYGDIELIEGIFRFTGGQFKDFPVKDITDWRELEKLIRDDMPEILYSFVESHISDLKDLEETEDQKNAIKYGSGYIIRNGILQ